MKPIAKSMSLRYLGNGPQATGGPGWSLGPMHLVRCIQCGDLITIPEQGPGGIKSCGCGALSFDLGRFGSNFGDAAVEVYLVSVVDPAS